MNARPILALATLALTLPALPLSLVAAVDTNAVQTEVRAVLERQARDWNAGNVEKFMEGYERAETTRFASGGNVIRGWQPVLERYQRNYPDKAAMGHLTFSEVDITVA